MTLRSVLFSARVAAALVLTVPVLGGLTVVVPARRVHALTQRWARVMVTLCGCRPCVRGLERLPKAAAVLVANHSSFLDSVVLLAAIPGEYRFVVNHRAARRPLLGRIIRKAGHLIVDRRSLASRAACARAMTTALASGTSLMLFPEGTRERDGLLPFHLGAFRAAARTVGAVTPVVIHGTRQMLPRDSRSLEPASLAVQILPAIAVAETHVRHAVELRDGAHVALARALADDVNRSRRVTPSRLTRGSPACGRSSPDP